MNDTATSNEAQLIVEHRAFEAAIDEGTSDALLAFLNRYPNSPFKDVVIVKLSQIKAGVQVNAQPAPAAKRRRFAGWTFLSGVFTGAAILGGGLAVAMSVQLQSAAVKEQLALEVEVPIDSASEALTRKVALLDAAREFSGSSFSDSDAESAITAITAIPLSELEADETLLTATEEILDSFFAADRFDYVERLNATHGDLFKRDARFYVSFCLAYGLRVLEAPSLEEGGLWSIRDADSFNDTLAKYSEYADLDIVKQRYPEYAVMYQPFILKLQGASDEIVVAKMRSVSDLEPRDKEGFIRAMAHFATGGYSARPDRPSVQLVMQRVKGLIEAHADDDPSGSWREVGLKSDMDL